MLTATPGGTCDTGDPDTDGDAGALVAGHASVDVGVDGSGAGDVEFDGESEEAAPATTANPRTMTSTQVLCPRQPAPVLSDYRRP